MLRRVVGTLRPVWSGPVTSFAFASDSLRWVVRGPEGRQVYEVDPRVPGQHARLDLDARAVRRAPFLQGAQPYRSPSGRRRLDVEHERLRIADLDSGSSVAIDVPRPCLETLDYYRWLDDDTLVWSETGVVLIDAGTGEHDVVWPVRPHDERDRHDGETFIDVSPDLRWIARQTDRGLNVGPLSIADPGGPLAPYIGTSRRLTPEELRHAMALGIAPSDERHLEAEGLANAIRHALRAWGVVVGDACRWATRRDDFVELEPIGESVLELIRRAHADAEVDGHAGVFASSEAFTRAFDDGLASAWKERGLEVDCRREHDVLADADYRSAVAWDLGVGAGRHHGRRFAELPNPFAPMLALWSLGVAARRADHRGIELVAV